MTSERLRGGTAAALPEAEKPVQQIYDNWGNRASLMEPSNVTADGDRYFKLGSYAITVPLDPEQPAKVSHLYYRHGADQNPMPNMSFSDGEMRIPIEDFVDLILRRVPADELAEGLWRDPIVRERFVECMVHTYAGTVEDADRRKFLRDVQVAVHAKAVDEAIRRLNDVETELRAKSSRSRWEQAQLGHYNGLHERYHEVVLMLREAGVIDDEAVKRRMQYVTTPEALKQSVDNMSDPVTKESVGAQWQESRDFWRKRLEECFPEPVEAAALSRATGEA